MGRKKTRVLIGRGFFSENQSESSVLLCGSFLGCCISARCFVNAGGSLVFLADLFNEAAGDQVLKLFISTQAEHFFSTAHCIADFEICKNSLEQVVETKHFLFRKDTTELICHMVRKAT